MSKKVLILDDYILPKDFKDVAKENKEIVSKISMSVLWNNERQKFNKGKYYVLYNLGKLYNILVNEECVIIDERTRYYDRVEEKNIGYNYLDDTYFIMDMKHDKNGSTHDLRYYIENSVCNMNSSEIINELLLLISNIKLINNIEDLVDINIFDAFIDRVKEQKKLKKDI